MKKQLLLLVIIFYCAQIQAQGNELWNKINQVSITRKTSDNFSGNDKIYYTLNELFLKQKLSKTTGKSAANNTIEITIPNSDGMPERFIVWESSNFEPELQAKYPDIKAYKGYGLDDTTAKIHFSFSPLGMQTMVIRSNKASEFIEKSPENKSQYVLFTSKNSNRLNAPLTCKTPASVNKNKSNKTSKPASDTKVLKTLRLALSCTGEYAAYFGGTKAGALAGMNATMTRVNGIFNKDLAVRLELIANNDDVIYTNAATDPYSNPGSGADGAWNVEVQNTLTTVLGNSAYDMGHLFGGSGGGGDAGCIGCVCVNPASPKDENAKGSAFSSPSNAIPEGDTFDIDYVAHEMGHQLGGSHTFSYDIEGTDVNVEPGSGSTIMGYAGVTDDYNIQNNSDDYFAYVSILEIQNNLALKSCPVSTPILNNPPIINAGSDYTIPFNTPFILTGSGSDADPGNVISYCWEQNDSATTTSLSNSFAYPAKPDGPLFRSLVPSVSPVRYMPNLSTVIENRLTTKWESVSSVARTLHFTLTGRDNAPLETPQTNTDEMTVTVNPAIGPFTVSSQSTSDIGWQNNSAQTITWNVNKTNTLPGSSNVDIKLSTDGGLTFPVVLASDTPNDGSHTITVPADITVANCRILIQPVNNIFYALNKNPFAIGYTSRTTCNSYSFGKSFSIPAGNTFTTRSVNVPASAGTVSDVNVSLSVTHSRLSDIEIEIQSPKGTIVKLFDKECGSSNSTLLLQYDDAGAALDCSLTTSQIVLPFGLLSAFNGENSEGNWILRVRDAVSGNFGNINSASVAICNQEFTLGVPDKTEVTDLVFYPNPNRGNFTVQLESDSTHAIQVLVHDILGQKIYDQTYEKTYYFNQNVQLDKTSSGLYFLTVIDGNREFVKKIVVN